MTKPHPLHFTGVHVDRVLHALRSIPSRRLQGTAWLTTLEGKSTPDGTWDVTVDFIQTITTAILSSDPQVGVGDAEGVIAYGQIYESITLDEIREALVGED